MAPPGEFTTSQPQDVTGYTASKYYLPPNNTKLRLTHNNTLPQLGYVTVRKASSNKPHVPFGSTIITPVSVNVGNYGTKVTNSFSVQDTGIVAAQSYYAIDIFWGYCRDQAYTGLYGEKLGYYQVVDLRFS
ncbi:hypothetical protein ACOI1C_21105 [Bacillus sp. DJP31]|uniref:hypothetical protein n=1 Tax=Bacillus sp. DJP31 TaxID=3409789 RepID=UPI003BB56E2C